MVIKKFGDKKIIIRKPIKTEAKNAKKFQVFINALVAEDAKILMNKKATLKDEEGYVDGMLKGVKAKTKVFLIAECDNKIIATTSIELERWRKNHIGIFAIAISEGCRGMGLGQYLMSEIIKLAKKELKPAPKIIRLDAYSNNKPAVGLYKKMGFKIVGKVPKQVQWKGKFVDELVMLKQI